MKVIRVTIDETSENQRLDNYLIQYLKGVPTSRVYRAIRQGEVRVNRKRMDSDYRLQIGDVVRIPPIRVAERPAKPIPPASILNQLSQSILFESDELIILNKPAGLPVHGGSGIRTGIIEALRVLRPQAKLLELVHRLDKETSGCLMIAKKRRMLVALHQLLTQNQVHKQYWALVKGRWEGGERWVDAPLKKNVLQSGERVVRVNEAGRIAATRFRPLRIFSETSLLEACPKTGRTHQIRVHAAHIGYPIVGDEKYGDAAFNKIMRAQGLKRLFLHAAGIYCQLPDKTMIGVCALLDNELKRFITNHLKTIPRHSY